MAIKGISKKTVKVAKKQSVRFTVDCSIPVADNVLDAAGLVSLLSSQVSRVSMSRNVDISL